MFTEPRRRPIRADHSYMRAVFCDDVLVPLTVLIVDDHRAFRAAATVMLESDGFEVVGEALDGRAALEAVERLRPSVVLLDIQLPGMDGIKVAERLATGVDPPAVVLVSSYDASVYGERLAGAPVRGFIPKSKLSGDALARMVA
jgi:DNA-binding NarL/FixJ family response regulator